MDGRCEPARANGTSVSVPGTGELGHLPLRPQVGHVPYVSHEGWRVPVQILQQLREREPGIVVSIRLLPERLDHHLGAFEKEIGEEGVRRNGLDAMGPTSRGAEVIQVEGHDEACTGADGSRQNVTILGVVGHVRFQLFEALDASFWERLVHAPDAALDGFGRNSSLDQVPFHFAKDPVRPQGRVEAASASVNSESTTVIG